MGAAVGRIPGKAPSGGDTKGGTSLAVSGGIVSGKFLGIGLLSVGCMAAAGGGYLAVRPGTPEPAPLAAVQPETASPVETVPGAADTFIEPDVIANAPAGEPVQPPARARQEPAASRTPAGAERPPIPDEPQPAPPAVEPTEAKVVAQSETTQGSTIAVALPAPVETTAETPPVVGSEVKSAPPPVAVAADPPRYLPDPPPLAVAVSAAAQESSRFEFEELTVEKHSVIGIRLDSSVSTKTARVEDRVTATVSRDVTVRGRTAIPADVRLEGTVTLVEHGGKFKNRPRLGLRFDRIIMADDTRVAIATETIYREGESPTPDATAKVGAGAVAGAILGGVFGGKKGAAIGGVAGAAGGAAVVMKEGAGETSIPAGAPLTVRLTEDLVINR